MSIALILIDIQNDYFPGGRMELVCATEAAGAAARLLGCFRKASWPVYHIQHVSTMPMATFFMPGTSGIDIHPNVLPLPCEPVIIKHYPNGFRETDLLGQLKTAAIDQLLICGMMTNLCVDATVRAAFDLGFTCTIAKDACATRDLMLDGEIVPAKQVQMSFLSSLSDIYAGIRSTDAIVEGIVCTL